MKRRRIENRQTSTPSGQSNQTRRGSSLVQMVITITVMSIMMTIVANALFRMYRQEALMVERTFETSTWLRLDRDFRQDIHAALMIKQSEDGNRLELVTTDGPVTWMADGEKIRRTTQSEELADDTDSSAIAGLPGEQYVFADSMTDLSLTVGTAGAASVAAIEVTQLPTPNGGTVSANVMMATAGLDHRFLTPVAMPEEQP